MSAGSPPADLDSLVLVVREADAAAAAAAATGASGFHRPTPALKLYLLTINEVSAPCQKDCSRHFLLPMHDSVKKDRLNILQKKYLNNAAFFIPPGLKPTKLPFIQHQRVSMSLRILWFLGLDVEPPLSANCKQTLYTLFSFVTV